MTLPIDSIETLVVRLPTRTDFRWNGLERPLGEVLMVRVRSGPFTGLGAHEPEGVAGRPARLVGHDRDRRGRAHAP